MRPDDVNDHDDRNGGDECDPRDEGHEDYSDDGDYSDGDDPDGDDDDVHCRCAFAARAGGLASARRLGGV